MVGGLKPILFAKVYNEFTKRESGDYVKAWREVLERALGKLASFFNIQGGEIFRPGRDQLKRRETGSGSRFQGFGQSFGDERLERRQVLFNDDAGGELRAVKQP